MENAVERRLEQAEVTDNWKRERWTRRKFRLTLGSVSCDEEDESKSNED